MAIMGDKVGSGKSFVIMALVFSTDHTPSHVDDVHIFDRGVVMLTEDRSAAEHLPLLEDGDDGSAADDDGAASRTWSYLPPSFPVVPTRQAKTSLLVVPHILFGQWTDYLKTYAPCEARWAGVNNTRSLRDLESSRPHTFDLILVTSTFYCRLYEVLVKMRLRLRRLVLEEADTMTVPGFRPVPSCFTWLVTATYERVLDGSMPSLCVIRDRLARIAFRMAQPGLLVIKTSDSFADSSFMLPDVVQRFVSCKEPRLLHVLNGRIDASIMHCLNANDVSGAFRLCDEVNTRLCETESALVSLMVSKPRKELNRVRVRRAQLCGELERRAADDGGGGGSQENERTALRAVLTDLERKEADLTRGIEDVRDRIERCDVCAICFDTVRHKTVVSCCSNGFCYGCLTSWLERYSTRCPMCKKRVSSADLNVLVTSSSSASPDDAATEEDAAEAEAAVVGSAMNDRRDKLNNLRVLVDDLLVRRLPREGGDEGEPRGRSYRKLIVFSEHDGTFREVSNVLKAASIRYAVLQGTPAHLEEVIASYRRGTLDVILANARCFGSGLNLQCTTDIVIMHALSPSMYRQVVGRAQRCGRTAPLTTWMLRHPNEER